MDVVRITELQPKTYVEQGDYIAIDNQSDGTKKVQFTNLFDDTLSQENKIAPANVVGDKIATIRAAVGSPLKASTVAQMTDKNKIYVYVGSESGYTNGNWYYWNGSAWTSGGVYNSVAVVTDPTLTLSGVPADAKVTGDEIGNLKSDINDNASDISALQTSVANLGTHKVAQPLDGNNQPTNGTSGQSLRTNGDGSTEWADVGLPTDEQTAQAISDWLDAHPEATTTVQDGSLIESKFSDALKLKTIKDYVTPEMFGAVGDGITDDVNAIDSAIATGKVVLLTKQYYISRPINIVSNTRIYGDRMSRRYDAPTDTNYIKTSGVAFFHSDTTIAMIQLFDIALWNASDNPNVVFDCRVDRSDFRVYGFNIYAFCNNMQGCNFDDCNFLNSKGTFSIRISDTDMRNCYFSGDVLSENPFLSGLISSLNMRGCYFDFWHVVFNPSYSYNNMIQNNIFDACYRVFVGEYNEFGIINNVFMRIKDSKLWSLGKNDWCVLCNGLRNRTRVIGNRVESDYFIHTSLTGNSYPNKDSYSALNSLQSETQIVWNPYPYDDTDLLNTRVEELNYKTYDSLPTASLIAGSGERFNHQIVNVGNELFINNNGVWKNISLSDEITLTFSAQTISANSSVNLYDNDASNHWLSARYYLAKPAFGIPATLTFCAYCHTDGVFRIIVSNPTNSAVSLPASTWKIKSFRF